MQALSLSRPQMNPSTIDRLKGNLKPKTPNLSSSTSQIRFVRHRMLHARPALSVNGQVAFGLRHIRKQLEADHGHSQVDFVNQMCSTAILIMQIPPKRFTSLNTSSRANSIFIMFSHQSRTQEKQLRHWKIIPSENKRYRVLNITRLRQGHRGNRRLPNHLCRKGFVEDALHWWESYNSFTVDAHTQNFSSIIALLQYVHRSN